MSTRKDSSSTPRTDASRQAERTHDRRRQQRSAFWDGFSSLADGFASVGEGMMSIFNPTASRTRFRTFSSGPQETAAQAFARDRENLRQDCMRALGWNEADWERAHRHHYAAQADADSAAEDASKSSLGKKPAEKPAESK